MQFTTINLSILLIVSAVNSLQISRRHVIASAGLVTTVIPSIANAGDSLSVKLSKKDPSVLKNSIFNIPPLPQSFPDWMKGSWQVTSKFGGYLFPSQTIPRDRLTQDFAIPGFQKCSIVATSDVGLDHVSYQMTILENGLEDRRSTLTSQIDAYLGYKAVSHILYDEKLNANRLSVDFVDFKTINAERIELFCNGREREEIDRDGVRGFLHSEYIRQVTFGTGSTVGVPRQVGGNYGHFWTWWQVDDTHLKGNLLTAAYLDPQDALYFNEPSKPVAVYSHVLSAERIPVVL